MGYKCASEIMKKFLFMLVMMCCTLCAMADDTKTCSVKGTTGQVAVTVRWVNPEKGDAVVEFSNDTDVAVSISYTVSGSGLPKRQGNTTVSPNQTASKTVKFPESSVRTFESDITVTIQGRKCE